MAFLRPGLIGVALAAAVAVMTTRAVAQVDDRPDPIGPTGPIAVCFNEGTDPRYVERVERFVTLRNQAFFGPDYYTNGSWSGSLGTPRALRWSFVPDGVTIPSGVGEPVAASNLFAVMDSAFASQGGRATWMNRFQQVFDRWAQLSGLSYTRIRFNNNDWDDGAGWGSGGSSSRGDIRIAMKLIDGSSGILAYNGYPQSGGDMVLDSGDSGLFASSSNQHRFLRNTVAHEHGHGMGLGHVCTNNAQILMEPFISTAFDGPRQDDTRGAQRNYGDDAEPNSTFGAALPLGALSMASPINKGTPPAPVSGSSDPNSSILSIEVTNRQDWFSFTFTEPMTANVTITPVGSTYDMAPQGGGGCPSAGSPMNALVVGNLAVDVYDSNGTSLLATANNTAAGQPETAFAPLAGTGTRYIKVYTTNSLSGTQCYRITITGSSPCPIFTEQPEGTTVCEGSGVLLTAAAAGTPAPTYQWRRNGENIPGATSASYVISQATPAQSGSYDVVATNSCGSVPSNPAVVTINSGPEITQQPQSQTVAPGSPVTFQVQLANPSGVVYQWRFDGSIIPLANGPSYNIASVSPEDAGSYDVMLFGDCGGQVFSLPAVLTVGSACYANCDGSVIQPVLNVADFICFQNKFAANDPSANCDGSTIPPVLNVADFVCFQSRFAQGCP